MPSLKTRVKLQKHPSKLRLCSSVIPTLATTSLLRSLLFSFPFPHMLSTPEPAQSLLRLSPHRVSRTEFHQKQKLDF